MGVTAVVAAVACAVMPIVVLVAERGDSRVGGCGGGVNAQTVRKGGRSFLYPHSSI